MSYLWVAVGSALGGVLRFLLGKLALPLDAAAGFPVGTVLINIAGSFVIGCFGTLTLHSGKYAVSENLRIFVMIGICGGFTTFSSFSLQTFDLARSGAWGRALANVILVCRAVRGSGRCRPSRGPALGRKRGHCRNRRRRIYRLIRSRLRSIIETVVNHRRAPPSPDTSDLAIMRVCVYRIDRPSIEHLRSQDDTERDPHESRCYPSIHAHCPHSTR